MRKKVLFIGCIVALVAAGTASALEIRLGNIIMDIDGGFTPTTLPADRNAPISVEGYARIKTADGTPPPPLTDIVIEWDRHGTVETRGLPTCTVARLRDTTTRDARRACGNAIIGQGQGRVVVNFPDQRPIPASTPITLFNGPRAGGDPTVIGHAFLTVPAPTAYVVPIRIRKINKGRYGYRTEAKIPRIAGGHGTPLYGSLKIGHRWTARIGGQQRRLSYINARCVGGRLQARAFFSFRDGSDLQGSLFRPCRVRR